MAVSRALGVALGLSLVFVTAVGGPRAGAEPAPAAAARRDIQTVTVHIDGFMRSKSGAI